MTFTGGLPSVLESAITSRANCHVSDLQVDGSLNNGTDLYVLGPASSTNSAIALFAGASGGVIKDSVLVVDNNGDIDKSGVEYIHERGGIDNFACGSLASRDITTGTGNTAVGQNSMLLNLDSSDNTAVGNNSLSAMTTGTGNVAVGHGALSFIASGTNNVCLGANAGIDLTLNDTNNICINNRGIVGNTQVIRIGTAQTKNFTAGIRGITTDEADAIAVLVDSTGQLGTVSSSIRYKKNINPMKNSLDLLCKLNPVSFMYKKHQNASRLHYGLIAEEVDEILPDLVVRNKNRQIETVQYEKLYAFLISAIQELSSEIALLKNK